MRGVIWEASIVHDIEEADVRIGYDVSVLRCNWMGSRKTV